MKSLENEVINTKYGLVLVNKNDMYIANHLRAKGCWCDEEVAAILKILRGGDIVVEVGANVGAHSIAIAAAIGAEGRLYAFEPQRIVFQQLAATVALNGLPNVHCIQRAVGRERAVAAIPPVNYSVLGNFAGVSLIEGRSSQVEFIDGDAEDVEVVTIDSLNLPACRLIKIDAEGMDLDVIIGARSTIERFRPVIVTEWEPAGDGRITASKLLELNYRLYALHSPGNYNLFCLPSEWNSAVIGVPEVSRNNHGEIVAISRHVPPQPSE